MIDKIVFYFLIIFCLFVLSLVYSLEGLYYFQLELYSCKSLLKRLVDYVRREYKLFITSLLLIVLFIIFDVTSLYIISSIIVIVSLVILLFDKKIFNLRKPKFTSRMIRIVISSLVVSILFFIVSVLYLPKIILAFSIPFVPIFLYLIICCVVVMLIPIEKNIGRYYIRLAKNNLASNRGLIKIGITGSYGKTSVKEILYSILKTERMVFSTPKNYNTPFGITKTINTTLNSSHEFFVCEMGAKKYGEIKELCELIDVDCGIVTAVGRQHTDTFGGINGVYSTKKELPDYLHGKLCVFNLMNVYTAKMYNEYAGKKIGIFICSKHNFNNILMCVKKVKKQLIKSRFQNNIIYFVFCHRGNYYAKNSRISVDGIVFDVCYDGVFLFSVKSSLIGEHNIINILLAVALSKEYGISDDNVKLGVSMVSAINARLEKYMTSSGAVVINNGYNSNIDTASYSLKTLNLFNKKNKVVITPGLIETEDDFGYNIKFGQLLTRYCTEVVVVKEKNKDAITSGLVSSGFDMSKVSYVDSFNSARRFIDSANEDYVFLIENDLPDNFK